MDGGAGKGKVDEVEKDALGRKAPTEGEGAGKDLLGSKEEKQGEDSNTNRKRGLELGATDLLQVEAKKKKKGQEQEQEQEKDSTDEHSSSVDACDIKEDRRLFSPRNSDGQNFGNSTTTSSHSQGPDASEDFILPDATEGVSSRHASKDHDSGGEQM